MTVESKAWPPTSFSSTTLRETLILNRSNLSWLLFRTFNGRIVDDTAKIKETKSPIRANLGEGHEEERLEQLNCSDRPSLTTEIIH